VILEPLDQGARVEGVTNGQKGSYLIGIIRPGRYAVKVSAAGLALSSVKAEASGLMDDKTKGSKWKLDARARADKPIEIQVEDGMEITCDLVLGKATDIAADQAYAMLRQQVRKGDCAGALPQIEKYTTDNPTHGEAFYLKGYCSAVLGKDDDAIAALTKSQELDPAFVGTSSLLGKVQARNKRLPEAEAAFKKELENPKAPVATQFDVLLSLGAVQRDQSKDADAEATFEKAIAVVPSRPEPYLELSALYTKSGQTDKAVAVLDRAKAAGAEDPVALLNVGISFFNKKDYPHAESMFRRVTESKAGNPDLAMAYGLLGRLQVKAGKNAAAIESLQKSLELDPAGRLAAESKDLLKSLQSKKK
jgi:Flp pilus assembly protein TadD